MRLIDADKLHYKKVWIENEDYDVKAAVVVFAKEIDKAPTVDAVPVVWCKDCKHCCLSVAYLSMPAQYKCELHERYVRLTDFCSNGVMRNEDETN